MNFKILKFIKYFFSRLDYFILKFEREELLDLKDRFSQTVHNEIVSQYFYILGLLFFKKETSEVDSLSDDEFSKETKAGLLSLVKSLSCSKPNTFQLTNQDNYPRTKNDPIMSLLLHDYAKLLHRDSCWRYSSIGCWIKFFAANSLANDNSKILKIINFSEQKFKVFF